MKKIIATIIALCALLSLTSCGGSSSAEASGNTAGGTTAPETQPPIKVEDLTDREITRGTAEGNLYSSDFSGLTFEKPTLWEFYTDEELADLTGHEADDLSESRFPKTLASTDTVYDASAYNGYTGTSVNISYENMLYSADKAVTADEYAELLKSRFAAGDFAEVEVIEETTVTLCGMEYRKIVCTADVYGVALTQAYYFRPIDAVMNCISVNIGDGTTIEEIEAMFS